MVNLLDLLKSSLSVIASAVAIVCNLLADLISDVEDTRDMIGDNDLTGTSGISEAGIKEPIVFDSDGNAIGSHTGTKIIG